MKQEFQYTIAVIWRSNKDPIKVINRTTNAIKKLLAQQL